MMKVSRGGATAALLVFEALAAVMMMAPKIYSVAVSGHEGYWWLGVPLDRRPMVARRLIRRLLLV